MRPSLIADGGRHLLVGPSHDGLWIVSDANGVCGALFNRREEALHFAREECAAARPAPADWRLVETLDPSSLFAPAGRGAK